MRRKLEQLDKKIATRKKLVKALHAACKHPFDQIVEGEWQENTYFRSDPEFRVCKVCGYAEEGWGCGFWKLGRGKYSGFPKLSRDEAFKYVVKFHTQDDMYKLKYPERFDKDGNEI